MNESTCGNSGHSSGQVVASASQDGVCHLSHAAALAAHHGGRLTVPVIIAVVLAVIAAGLLVWGRR